MGVYELKTRSRGARPRSKRLRELGGSGAAASGGGTIVNVYGGSNAIGDSHYHENKHALDQITTDADGYQYLTRLQETTDAEGNEAYTEVTEKVKAGFADVAHDLSTESPVRELFLSCLVDDVAKGNITFEKMIMTLGLAIFKDGAAFGEFASSLYAGIGANIDAQGNAEFESVRVRSYFECLELIINRLAAVEGDQILTEGDTIERVDDLGDGRYGLQLKSKWEGYRTAQVAGNVLKGIVNTLAEGAGVYRTSWLRVDKVNTADNYIEATLYPDAATPAGTNYPPCELMAVARWGHQTDTARQSCIYLSSSEGRIVHLTGVTKPIIDASNYGATFGTLPEFLREMNLPVVSGQDYVYARGLIVQDIIRIDYQGKPVVEIVDRGPWTEGAAYYCEALNPATGRYETSDVWHNGCRYRCALTGVARPPAWSAAGWVMVEGDPDLVVTFAESDTLCDPDNFNQTLTVVVRKHNEDITPYVLRSEVIWRRYSEDANGVQRADLDAAWNARRGAAGKTITLTLDDVDKEGDVLPKVLRFIATVRLTDTALAGTETDLE